MQEIVRCPVTKLGLEAMTDEQLNQVNRRILNYELRHLDGTSVQKPLAQGFLSDDGRFAYIVEDGIILLLAAFAIALRPEEPDSNYRLREEKAVVQNWYNEYGWKTGEGGKCLDSMAFGDLRPVTREYDHKTNLRPLEYLREGGRYLLDVASGAVPQPEYLNFSDAFEKRICIDLSFLALQQARKKLGDKGIYILGDITNLPLQDDVCDAVISLHTIYHVPADEQGSAFRELYRVLKPGRTALVIYNWGEHSWLMRLAELPLNPVFLGAVHRLKRLFGKKPKTASSGEPSLPPRPTRGLYFHAHNYRWFQQEMRRYFEFDIVCWRIVNQTFLVYYVRPRFFGKTFLKLIYWCEETFPHLAARCGQFPMFIIKKPAKQNLVAPVEPAASPESVRV
jgi:ubiquinone/menaquinone biosynthesis C-methylase UbiE